MKGFLKPNDNVFFQVIKSALAGVFALAVDYGLCWVFLKIFTFKYGYMPANTIGFLMGNLISYILSVKWIFLDRAIKDKKQEFTIFLILSAIGLLINTILLYILVEAVYFKEIIVVLSEGIHRICHLELGDLWISKILVTIIVFFWNFFARKIILFKKTER